VFAGLLQAKGGEMKLPGHVVWACVPSNRAGDGLHL